MNPQPILIGSIRTAQLGEVWVAVSNRGLTSVEFRVRGGEFKSSVQKQLHREVQFVPIGAESAVDDALCQIEEYLAGRRQVFQLRIDWSVLGSDFQRMALKAVFAIPFGEVRTYGQIAAQIGCPHAPRAVGRANATNPMPLVIPCHRVIGTDGKLHGYGGAGGLKTKAWLLRMEGASVPGLPG